MPSTSTKSWELIVLEVPKGQQIAELRREIEQIGEQNRIYRSKGKHIYQWLGARERNRLAIGAIHCAPRCRLRGEDAAGMLPGTTRSLKQKALEEARRMLVITAYLWVLFSVFEVHRVAVLRGQHLPTSYRIGFSLINALILAKVILVADALHAGKRKAGTTMFAAVMFKSGILAIILVCFNVVEDVMVGLFHGKTLAESVPEVAGGGLEGQLLVGLMIFVVLIPFCAFEELRRAIGQDAFNDLLFRRKTP